MHPILAYMKNLTFHRAILWCYLIWYLVMAGFYFDPTPRLWLTSAGLGVIIGFALILSVTAGNRRLDPWQSFRLFLVPFCVSSFSGLVKDHGFVVIFSPDPVETGLALALCTGFLGIAWLARRLI